MKTLYALVFLGLLFANPPFSKKVHADDLNKRLDQQKLEFMGDNYDEPVSSVETSGSSRMTVFLNGRQLTQSNIKSFNSSIKQNNLSGEIILCRRSIDIPVGRVNANTSHGGVCLYSDKGKYTPVYICNDEMVGHFKMTPIDGATNGFKGSISEIANFTMKNCFGG